jgi:hypothetical protein
VGAGVCACARKHAGRRQASIMHDAARRTRRWCSLRVHRTSAPTGQHVAPRTGATHLEMMLNA